MSELALGVGPQTRSPWFPEPTEVEIYSTVRANMCSSTSVYQFLKEYLNKSLGVDTNPTTPIEKTIANNAILEQVCKEGATTNSDDYGDIRLRITRAYIHANPAFMKVSSGCLETSINPFSDTKCPTAATFIAQQLSLAASDVNILRSETHTLPSTSEMLYRLFLIAAISHADRTLNVDHCFGNYESLNASMLCHSAYSVLPSLPPQVPIPGRRLSSLVKYEDVVQNRFGDTCQSRNGLLTDPPSPPPAPAWIYFEDHGNTGDDAILACTHVLTWGLFDQRRLFGIPDPRGEFKAENNYADFLSSYLYNAVGLGRMKEAWDTSPTSSENKLSRRRHPPTRLLLYAAYRMSATTVLCTATGVSVGFYIGWTSVPLFVQLALRIFGSEATRTENDEKQAKEKRAEGRRPPTIPFVFASLVAIISTAWSLYVEPLRHISVYYIDPSCSGWASNDISSPWMTSDVYGRKTDWWIAFIPLGLVSYAVVYNYLCRGGKCNANVRKKIEESETLLPPGPTPIFAILSQISVIFFLALVASNSWEEWFNNGIENPFSITEVAHITKMADIFATDCITLALSSFFIGFFLGALVTRSFIEDKEAIQKTIYASAVFGSCFFPFLIQSANTVKYKEESDRAFWGTAALIAQGFSALMAFTHLRPLLSLPCNDGGGLGEQFTEDDGGGKKKPGRGEEEEPVDTPEEREIFANRAYDIFSRKYGAPAATTPYLLNELMKADKVDTHKYTTIKGVYEKDRGSLFKGIIAGGNQLPEKLPLLSMSR
tara:strand:+ start:781 stop:3093 length:2313 start_codon:yes stop_codon:yes gene_type:complete